VIRRIRFDALLFVCNRILSRLPSHRLRLLLYRKLLGFEIGSKSYILMGARFSGRGGFSMGDHSVINESCRLDNRAAITIGASVSISPEVCILTADHDLQSPTFAGRERPVRIADHVFVGTRATILPGVSVAEGAAVAAGAVVTRDVEPYTIVAGVPARPVGTRPQDLRYELDYGRLFA
jgi:acetyltransferase-like isoleucine patch superfamily enzyme